MGVFSSLSTGIATTRRNPIVLGLVFAYSLVASALLSLQVVDPLLIVPGYLIVLAVLPFYLGGLIGTIHEGLDGRASLARFTAAGRSSYLSVLAGGIALFVLTFVAYIVAIIVGLVLSVVLLGTAGLSGIGGVDGFSVALIAVLVLVGLFELFLIYLPAIVFQFFPAAVVVDGLGVADSFKRSAGLLRDNFLSVIGFDALTFAFGLLLNVPTAYLFYRAFSRSGTIEAGETIFDILSTTELVAYFGVTVVLGGLIGAVVQSYYVAYYDQLRRGSAA